MLTFSTTSLVKLNGKVGVVNVRMQQMVVQEERSHECAGQEKAKASYCKHLSLSTWRKAMFRRHSILHSVYHLIFNRSTPTFNFKGEKKKL